MITTSLWLSLLLFVSGPDFESSLSKALQLSQQENQALVLFFTASECEPCNIMGGYFEKPDIQNILEQNYVAARVDISDFDGKACQEIYQVNAVPALLIVEQDGKVLYKTESFISETSLKEILINPRSVPISQTGKQDNEHERSISKLTQNDSSGSNNLYKVQVGYFGVKENADGLNQNLALEGLPVETIIQEKEGRMFYRVLVGSYIKESSARMMLAELESRGYKGKIYF
jgi:thioredoxin-related protein